MKVFNAALSTFEKNTYTVDSVNLQRMAQKLVFLVRLTNSKSFCSFLCHYFWVQNIFLQLACHRFMGQHGEKMKSTAVRWARGIFMESMVTSLPAICRLTARQSWNLKLGAALTHEWHMGLTNTFNSDHACCHRFFYPKKKKKLRAEIFMCHDKTSVHHQRLRPQTFYSCGCQEGSGVLPKLVNDK